MRSFESFVRSIGRPSPVMTLTFPLKPSSRSFKTAPKVPEPLYHRQCICFGTIASISTHPPTITTFSDDEGVVLTLTCRLPPLISASFPVIYTPPSFSITLNLFSARGAGESSTSPVAVLKHAAKERLSTSHSIVHRASYVPPCHGHVRRPSGVRTPFFNGAP